MNEQEVFTILGIRPYSFKDDKSQRLIEGATLHVVNNNSTDEDVTGSVVDKMSLGRSIVDALTRKYGGVAGLIGLSITPVYNKRGKVVDVIIHEDVE